eukprot:jgi/Galph1/3654/GphlegSOOS_G2339.1
MGTNFETYLQEIRLQPGNERASRGKLLSLANFIDHLSFLHGVQLHWFEETKTVLACWFQFTSTNHRIRYVVLYEAPPVGKLPYKLIRSLEIIAERLPDSQQLDDFQAKQLVDSEEKTSSETNQKKISIFPGDTFQSERHLGVFYGTARRTIYHPFDGSVVDDTVFPFRQCIHVMRKHSSASSSENTSGGETCRTIEIPVFEFEDGASVIREFLLLERYYLNCKKTRKTLLDGTLNPVERRRRRRHILELRKNRHLFKKDAGPWGDNAFDIAKSMGASLIKRLLQNSTTSHASDYNSRLLVDLCPSGVIFRYFSDKQISSSDTKNSFS